MRVLLEKAVHLLLSPFACSSLAQLASQPRSACGFTSCCKVLLDSIASPRPRPAPVLPEFAQAAVGSSQVVRGRHEKPGCTYVCENGERTEALEEPGARARSDEAVSPLLLAAQVGGRRLTVTWRSTSRAPRPPRGGAAVGQPVAALSPALGGRLLHAWLSCAVQFHRTDARAGVGLVRP
ncbi:hypothetical protein PAPYR_9979 [Paratrimastix pyriformis]|uniref:Secreted protein n=1 Tax=Paratrimastix pyriformis TaxID=342808 RepID=A0ABQ8UB58_9EUKA|nr:hypothetical protein PAPYR_9979 [Paratrimastix pyriformis]